MPRRTSKNRGHYLLDILLLIRLKLIKIDIVVEYIHHTTNKKKQLVNLK